MSRRLRRLTGTKLSTSKPRRAQDTRRGANPQFTEIQAKRIKILGASDDDYAKFTRTGIVGRNTTEVKSDLGLTIGTNVQAWDAGLDSISGATFVSRSLVTASAQDTYILTPITASGLIDWTVAQGATNIHIDNVEALQNVVEDTTPELGGALNASSNNITNVGNFSSTGTFTVTASSADDLIVNASGVPNAFFVQGSDGFVGINTSTPSYELDINGVAVVGDHGTGATDQVVNVSYGTTSTPPTASDTTEGSLYIQYTA